MKRQVLKEDIGKFGKLIAGGKEFKKTVYGIILYVDHFGVVIFIDNDDIAHRYSANTIESFEEEEFKAKV